MRAKIIRDLIDTGSAARDFIRLVCGREKSSVRPVTDDKTREGATELLEIFRNHRRKRESDHILTGRRVITAMDEQLRSCGSAGQQFADWITKGSFLSLPGDDRRYEIVTILWEDEAIKVQDDEGHTYIVPWRIIEPWPIEDEE